MGNLQVTDIIAENASLSKCNANIKASPFKRNKRRDRNHKTNESEMNPESFIIHHSKNQKFHGKVDKAVGLKRVVFISLLGLYQTYKQCPSHILYASIFILPLKECWIYDPLHYVDEIESCFFSHLNIVSDASELNAFINLLRWKNAQGLVFWALGDYNDSLHLSQDTLVSPFWCYFSSKLSKLYDAVTRSNYNALNLNIGDFAFMESKYVSRTSSILVEMFFFNMKYKQMQEIIHQSNPNSLCPIVSWVNDSVSCATLNDNIYDEFDNEDKENWWISCDYDPYDLE